MDVAMHPKRRLALFDHRRQIRNVSRAQPIVLEFGMNRPPVSSVMSNHDGLTVKMLRQGGGDINFRALMENVSFLRSDPAPGLFRPADQSMVVHVRATDVHGPCLARLAEQAIVSPQARAGETNALQNDGVVF